jgi:virulence factor Mce-like protein
MRRVLASLLLLCAAGAFVLVQAGAGEESRNRFKVELDNAFGLVNGADLKIAGVRAGTITDMDVDRRSKRAVVEFEITKQGFGSLRTDTFCETRPQSLIGEYFIDCEPGQDAEKLAPGSTIPVERTASTVPGDLVNNLNAAIRRASPALRETDRVLAILARQNDLLADLVRDGDTVIGDLAGNRRDVTRWVKETGETAAASAARREAIAASLERLPRFLAELRPTMAELGRVADAQTPALTDLQASAGQLEELFTDLGPFADSTRVNLRALAQAAEPGVRAARAAQPSIDELERFSADTPELAKNLAIVLKHLDDREASAVEPDPRSPGGQGYTGLEAILQYVYDQTMAINVFDRNGYILKANLHAGECAEYQNLDTLKAHIADDPDFLNRCLSELGPNYPGLNQDDPSAGFGQSAGTERQGAGKRRGDPQTDARTGDNGPDRDTSKGKPPVDLRDTLEDLLGPLPVPNPLQPNLDKPLDALREQLGRGKDPAGQSASDALADFLFGS